MSQELKITIVGVTGYTGLELLRLLALHPNVKVVHVLSGSPTHEKVGDAIPHLAGICNLLLNDVTLEEAALESDVVFFALPHGEAQKMVPRILGTAKIIDLSGDFRLRNVNMFKKYYGFEHTASEIIPQFIYGLPEVYRNEICVAKNIANAGCFATVTQLALFPLRTAITGASVFAITGSSGSGKSPREETHHPIRSHNVKSYKIGQHQHIPEILQTLGVESNQFVFVPTSGPFTRGIHLTAFVQLGTDVGDVRSLYKKAYVDAPFVRLKDSVQLADVVGSNFCDISVRMEGETVVVQAVIDNLVKGAAGSAIQNMNLMCGLPETAGLAHLIPLYP